MRVLMCVRACVRKCVCVCVVHVYVCVRKSVCVCAGLRGVSNFGCKGNSEIAIHLSHSDKACKGKCSIAPSAGMREEGTRNPRIYYVLTYQTTFIMLSIVHTLNIFYSMYYIRFFCLLYYACACVFVLSLIHI